MRTSHQSIRSSFGTGELVIRQTNLSQRLYGQDLKTGLQTCNLSLDQSLNAYLAMPGGEVLKSPIQAGAIPPFATQAEEQAFVNLNYLARPPLTDDEILIMPVDELIGLYYQLHTIQNCKFVRNAQVSGMLFGSLALQHEVNLQYRIFSLRSELHTVHDEKGRSYRVLANPADLDMPKSCSGKSLEMVIDVIVTIVGIFVPVVQVAYAVYKAEQTYEQLKAAGRTADFINEITTGIKLAKQNILDPVPTPQQIANLRNAYFMWQQAIKQAKLVAHDVNLNSIHICGPASMLRSQYQSNVVMPDPADDAGKYAGTWQPYDLYFLTESVKNLVFPPAPSSTARASQSEQAVIGAGIGALLLLLL